MKLNLCNQNFRPIYWKHFNKFFVILIRYFPFLEWEAAKTIRILHNSHQKVFLCLLLPAVASKFLPKFISIIKQHLFFLFFKCDDFFLCTKKEKKNKSKNFSLSLLASKRTLDLVVLKVPYTYLGNLFHKGPFIN